MSHVLTIAIVNGPRLWREAVLKRCNGEPGLTAVEVKMEELFEQETVEDADVLLTWGDLDGHQVAEIVERIAPCQRVMIVGQPTMDASTPLDAVVDGKVIWIQPDMSLEGLLATLQRPAQHAGSCSPQLLALVAQEVQLRQRPKPSDDKDAPCQLTTREIEVAGLVAEGLLNKQIARRLGIGVVTVKSHVHSLMRKLRVSRRGQVGRRVGSHAFPFSAAGVLPSAR